MVQRLGFLSFVEIDCRYRAFCDGDLHSFIAAHSLPTKTGRKDPYERLQFLRFFGLDCNHEHAMLANQSDLLLHLKIAS